MTLVRTCWWASALLLILLGSTVAVLALPVSDVLLRVVAGFLVGLTGALVLRDLVGPQFGPPTPGSAGAVGRDAGGGGGRQRSSRAARVLLLTLLVVLTSPAARRCCGLALRAHLRSLLGHAGSVPPSSALSWPLLRAFAVAQLDDQEVVRAWQQSGEALEQGGDPDDQFGWLLARQTYLDEIERRHPDEFARWLSGGEAPSELWGTPVPEPPGDRDIGAT